jgi:hypothetical protein
MRVSDVLQLSLPIADANLIRIEKVQAALMKSFLD